jgi:hypothetical protein
MLTTLLNALFGCSHKRTSFPFTPRSAKNVGQNETYVVCLSCGTEFHYDWQAMKIRKPVIKSGRDRASETVATTDRFFPAVNLGPLRSSDDNLLNTLSDVG